MNTQNVFPETERKDLGQIPGAISTQDTVEQRVSPPPPFQQPPQQPPPPPSRGNRWTWFAVVAVAWEVIRVETRGVTITSPQERSVLNSPMTVTGNGGASYEAQIGVLYVLDHLYNPVGQGYAMGSSSGPATFTTSVPYSVSFHGGAQEGVVALYATSAADGMMYAAIMHKEMLAG